MTMQLLRCSFLFVLLFISNGFVFGQVDATKYLPANYSNKGDKDYTEYLQKAINENDKLLMPNFPILVNYKGLKLKSNSEIIFQKNAALILTPSNTRSYEVLNIENVRNVKVINPTIYAERQERFQGKTRTGEWGMCIAIRSSENVSIRNAKLYNAWGDGIYLGKSNANKITTNKNITINDSYIAGARRNGISVTTAKGLRINNVTIENTKGKSPQAALDIEPNGRFDTIDNIEINNLITKNNVFAILISLRKLIDIKPQSISISIKNHKDEGSVQAFRYAGFNNAYQNIDQLKPIQGQIVVENAFWTRNKGSFTYEDGKGLLPELIFYNLNTLYNNKRKSSTDYQYISNKQRNIKFKTR
ncbi:glycoside hydrolase family protein [Vaginella massiliensis]|uniref:right-handed parallel beta-helix repeat-containing protein n=1 Tax=Vaginella massiliensis TaxID=1816680 RepID=UPI0012B61C1D|nr:right-handed parallel beta-helix repeat-containing protein [Vaginella massiliensis]